MSEGALTARRPDRADRKTPLPWHDTSDVFAIIKSRASETRDLPFVYRASVVGSGSARPAAAGHPLRRRVAEAIVDAAAELFARAGTNVSMADVAAEAGVARATVYRYFPNRARRCWTSSRGALSASQASASRAARLDAVPVHEGDLPRRPGSRRHRRLVRRARPRARAAGRRGVRASLARPLRDVLERGQRGSIRGDIPSEWLAESLVALVVSICWRGRSLGPEDTIAAVTRLFLDGAGAGSDG